MKISIDTIARSWVSMILASEENIFFQIWERKKIEITLHTFDKLSMINCDQIPFLSIRFALIYQLRNIPFTQVHSSTYLISHLIDSGKLRIKAVIKSALEFTRKTLVKILTFHASKSNLLSWKELDNANSLDKSNSFLTFFSLLLLFSFSSSSTIKYIQRFFLVSKKYQKRYSSSIYKISRYSGFIHLSFPTPLRPP